MAERRVGLVLSGGGAKGAYQVGVLQALEERGICPDLIAGTSVGAFNASIWMSTGVKGLASAWEQLSRGVWPRISPWAPFAPVSRFFAYSLFDRSRIPPRRRRFMSKQNVVLFVGMAIAAVIWGVLTGSSVRKVLIPLVVMTALEAVYLLSQSARLSLFQSNPLTAVASTHCDWKVLAGSKRSLFITCAREAVTYLPERAAEAAEGRRSNSEMAPEHAGFWTKNLEGWGAGIVPDYFPAGGMNADDLQAAVTASMTLPVIFKDASLGANHYVDGGLADNTPAYPLLLAGCSPIYTVYLEPHRSNDDWLWGNVFQVHNRRRRAGYSFLFADPHLLDSAILTEIDTAIAATKRLGIPSRAKAEAMVLCDLFERAQIIHIGPQRRLGLPLISTVWFTRRSAERFRRLGYADAIKALDQAEPVRPRGKSAL